MNQLALPNYMPNVKSIGILCFAGYWVFFGLWGVINTYHEKKFSVSWIILFFTLNIFALFLLKVDEIPWFRELKAHRT